MRRRATNASRHPDAQAADPKTTQARESAFATYSVTTNQAAIIALFREINQRR
jgi:hypothetical protein